ncbi:hypothetical protein F5X97DRAFT_323279 [Nemania serpens]|nr:hypothetical protein F5X97DRAFT_323279 [Nemania serpens]
MGRVASPEFNKRNVLSVDVTRLPAISNDNDVPGPKTTNSRLIGSKFAEHRYDLIHTPEVDSLEPLATRASGTMHARNSASAQTATDTGRTTHLCETLDKISYREKPLLGTHWACATNDFRERQYAWQHHHRVD